MHGANFTFDDTRASLASQITLLLSLVDCFDAEVGNNIALPKDVAPHSTLKSKYMRRKMLGSTMVFCSIGRRVPMESY